QPTSARKAASLAAKPTRQLRRLRSPDRSAHIDAARAKRRSGRGIRPAVGRGSLASTPGTRCHHQRWIAPRVVVSIGRIVTDVVGSYRIIRKIGEGGMGAVYVAEHTLIGRQAAIKVLQREMSHRQDLVTRFFNEARAATAVKHPGIVEIYDFGYHTGGSAYIVMEYLEGETLAARLRRTGPLPAARAAALGRQVAGALGAAHAKGIVHRDLKPDNIFIVRDPDIMDGERSKILDFGIAKLATG